MKTYMHRSSVRSSPPFEVARPDPPILRNVGTHEFLEVSVLQANRFFNQFNVSNETC